VLRGCYGTEDFVVRAPRGLPNRISLKILGFISWPAKKRVRSSHICLFPTVWSPANVARSPRPRLSAADFLSLSELTLQRLGAFATNAAAPPQGGLAAPFLVRAALIASQSAQSLRTTKDWDSLDHPARPCSSLTCHDPPLNQPSPPAATLRRTGTNREPSGRSRQTRCPRSTRRPRRSGASRQSPAGRQ